MALRQLLRKSREHRSVVATWPLGDLFLPLLDQQPVLGIAGELRRHQRPGPLQPLPLEPDRKPAVLLLLDQLVGAFVPDLDLAGAVLALRDLAFEAGVVEGVILRSEEHTS